MLSSKWDPMPEYLFSSGKKYFKANKDKNDIPDQDISKNLSYPTPKTQKPT